MRISPFTAVFFSHRVSVVFTVLVGRSPTLSLHSSYKVTSFKFSSFKFKFSKRNVYLIIFLFILYTFI